MKRGRVAEVLAEVKASSRCLLESVIILVCADAGVCVRVRARARVCTKKSLPGQDFALYECLNHYTIASSFILSRVCCTLAASLCVVLG